MFYMLPFQGEGVKTKWKLVPFLDIDLFAWSLTILILCHRTSNCMDYLNVTEWTFLINAKYYIAKTNANIYTHTHTYIYTYIHTCIYILLNASPRVYQTLSLYLKMSNFLVPFQFVRISTSIISSILRMSLVD